MKNYTGIYIVSGSIRKMTFEAESLEEATALARVWNVGVEGETQNLLEAANTKPTAYDLKTTCRLLGNISASTVYRELAVGNLTRVAGQRRILVTRESVEKWNLKRKIA